MGLIQSFTRPVGLAQPLILRTYDDSGGLTTGSPTADRATLVWIGRNARALRVVDFTIYVSTAAGTTDLGMFTLSAKTGTPTATRLGSTGSQTVVGASAIQTLTPSAPLWLPAGIDLWVGQSFSSASAVVGRGAILAVTSAIDARVVFSATQTPLGTGFVCTIGSSFLPWVAIRLSET